MWRWFSGRGCSADSHPWNQYVPFRHRSFLPDGPPCRRLAKVLMTLRYYQALLERQIVNWHQLTVIAQEWSDLYREQPWDVSKMRANREAHAECLEEYSRIYQDIEKQLMRHYKDSWKALQKWLPPSKTRLPLHLLRSPGEDAPADWRVRVMRTQRAMLRMSDFMERLADGMDMGDCDGAANQWFRSL